MDEPALHPTDRPHTVVVYLGGRHFILPAVGGKGGWVGCQWWSSREVIASFPPNVFSIMVTQFGGTQFLKRFHYVCITS